jgi:hypothetical protein
MGTPKPHSKKLGVGRNIVLRAYPIVSQHLELTVRGMFRQAAKYAQLDPSGELTAEQHSRAHLQLMADLCELLDFGGGDA